MTLAIRLAGASERYREGEELGLTATYTNRGDRPLALALWWTRTLQIRDAGKRLVAPGPGPVLPCGVAEELEHLAPGARLERAVAMACTQPAGRTERIGWSYALVPGFYKVVLLFESPPGHGFTQHAPDPTEFRGRVESNEVAFVVEPRRRGFLRSLLG